MPMQTYRTYPPPTPPSPLEGAVIDITNSTGSARRSRSLLASGNEPDVVYNFTVLQPGGEAADFDPQTGVIALKSITFLINFGGQKPLMTADVGATGGGVLTCSCHRPACGTAV